MSGRVQRLQRFVTRDTFTPYIQEPLFNIIQQRRGWDERTLRDINNPQYDTLKDIDRMTAVLHHLRQTQQQIVVLPDYDMDGVTSGVLGWAGLNELGLNAELFVPDHRAGHDISVATVSRLKEQFPDAAAVITCDGGINSNEGIRHGQHLGMTMLVTDHHVESPPGSVADVAINPARMDEEYSHPGICGAFVFYQVIMHYAKTYSPHQISDIRMLKLFAGIGTVSDVMPLLYENRQIVRDSISIARLCYLNMPVADRATPYDIEQTALIQLLRARQNVHSPAYVSVFEGFALLLKEFREARKLGTIAEITEEFYGFYLAPTFNSVRRIDGQMEHAFGAFTAETIDDKTQHIQQLLEYNEHRKELVTEYMERLNEFDQPLAPTIWFTDAPGGMVGLLASKLQHETDQPTIVLNHQSFSGSGRAPFWFNIIEELTAAGFTAVGHEQACGVSARSADAATQLRHLIESRAHTIYQQMLADGSLAQMQQADLILGDTNGVDAPANNMDAMLEASRIIESLEPYGQGFPRPVIEFRLSMSKCRIQVIGSDETHLAITTQTGLKMLWWNAAEQYYQHLMEAKTAILPNEMIRHFQGSFSINRFMGQETVQVMIDQMLPVNDTTNAVLFDAP